MSYKWVLKAAKIEELRWLISALPTAQKLTDTDLPFAVLAHLGKMRDRQTALRAASVIQKEQYNNPTMIGRADWIWAITLYSFATRKEWQNVAAAKTLASRERRPLMSSIDE